MSSHLDYFPQGARQKAVEIANAVTSNVVFEPWTPEQMNQNWRKRSHKNVTTSKSVNVCVPCIDTAALAAVYLQSRDESARLVLMTEQGAAEGFVQGKKRKLHLDAAVEFNFQDRKYLLDIGSGDLSLLGELCYSDAQRTYRTTRHDEPAWKRTEISSISEIEIVLRKNERIMDLFLDNVSRLPFGLNLEHFFQYNPDAKDGDEFYNHSEVYDAKDMRAWNRGWTEGVQHFFPGLKPFNYRD